MSGLEIVQEVSVQRVGSREDVDIQISTAKAYPRATSKFKANLETWATANEDAAEACIFALPRAGKTIEGPSIRLAELALAAWGNSRVKAIIIDGGRQDPDFVTVEGVFWDLETNSAISKQVKRRITDKDGRRYPTDLIVQTINAASSIAVRNAVLAGIPKALWEEAYLKAREIVKGDATTLANKRAAAIAYLAKFGVTEAMILATLEKKGIEDIDADDIVTLRASARAIRDGETKIEDAFIDPAKAAKATPAQTGGMAGLAAVVAGPDQKGSEGNGAAEDEAKAAAGGSEGGKWETVVPAASEEVKGGIPRGAKANPTGLA